MTEAIWRLGVLSYATTTWVPDGTLVITYAPASTTLTVNMAKMAGATTAQWYDPTTGTFTAIAGSPFADTGSQQFSTPGNNAAGDSDWVLLLQSPAH